MSNEADTVYPWLDSYWDKLIRYLQQDRLPSGMMLVGDEGLGLLPFARAFVKRAICYSPIDERLACGKCESCLLFDVGNYPDFFYVTIEEDKKSISIDDIRKLSASLELSNQYSKPRIAIINPADRMLRQASNSLLKTLEEPNANTSIILIANELSNIPLTIRSRCQLITISDIDLSKAALWLEQLGCEKANQYLNLANHSPLLARDLWKIDALTVRQAFFNDFIMLIKGRLDPLVFVEKCLKLKNIPILSWLMSWLTDVVSSAYTDEKNHFMNADLLDDLKVLKERLHLKDNHELLSQLGRLIQLQSYQVNQQLMLEEFAIQCYSLSNK